jgi:hypothetical protein
MNANSGSITLVELYSAISHAIVHAICSECFLKYNSIIHHLLYLIPSHCSSRHQTLIVYGVGANIHDIINLGHIAISCSENEIF